MYHLTLGACTKQRGNSFWLTCRLKTTPIGNHFHGFFKQTARDFWFNELVYYGNIGCGVPSLEVYIKLRLTKIFTIYTS